MSTQALFKPRNAGLTASCLAAAALSLASTAAVAAPSPHARAVADHGSKIATASQRCVTRELPYFSGRKTAWKATRVCGPPGMYA